MSRNDPTFTPVLLALVVGGIVCAAPWARAKDGAAPAAPKKVEHPFVKAVLGTWDWTSKRPDGGEEKGTQTFRLGLLDTVVIDDLEGTSRGAPFQGHGVWTIAADGTSLSGWWFFSALPGVRALRGTLTPDGYDLKSDDGERMTLRRTAGGLEMKGYQGDVVTRTVTFTKR
jgi:hypothetical protein